MDSICDRSGTAVSNDNCKKPSTLTANCMGGPYYGFGPYQIPVQFVSPKLPSPPLTRSPMGCWNFQGSLQYWHGNLNIANPHSINDSSYILTHTHNIGLQTDKSLHLKGPVMDKPKPGTLSTISLPISSRTNSSANNSGTVGVINQPYDAFIKDVCKVAKNNATGSSNSNLESSANSESSEVFRSLSEREISFESLTHISHNSNSLRSEDFSMSYKTQSIPIKRTLEHSEFYKTELPAKKDKN